MGLLLILLLLIGCGQLCLSSYQIPGFVNRHYFWKESIVIVDFFHGGNHYGKVAFKTTTFG